jgi:hypothetical protein
MSKDAGRMSRHPKVTGANFAKLVGKRVTPVTFALGLLRKE